MNLLRPDCEKKLFFVPFLHGSRENQAAAKIQLPVIRKSNQLVTWRVNAIPTEPFP